MKFNNQNRNIQPNNNNNMIIKRPSVLDNYVRDNGGTLKYITPEEIQRYALRIFKDMAYGNIDSKDIGERYVDFFSSRMVLENLKVVIDQKLYDSMIKYKAIEFYYENNVEGKSYASTFRGNELYQAEYSVFNMYSIISNILADAIDNPTNCIRILFCVEYNLNKYKKYLNKLV